MKLFLFKLLTLIYIIYGCDIEYRFIQYWPATQIYINNINISNSDNNHFNIYSLMVNDNNITYRYCKTNKFNISSLNIIYDDLEIYWTNYINTANFITNGYYEYISCLFYYGIFSNELFLYKYFLMLRNRLNIYELFFVHNVNPNNNYLYETQYLNNLLNYFYGYNVIITCLLNNNNIWMLDKVIFCYNYNNNSINCDNDIDKCKSKYILYGYSNIQVIDNQNIIRCS